MRGTSHRVKSTRVLLSAMAKNGMVYCRDLKNTNIVLTHLRYSVL